MILGLRLIGKWRSCCLVLNHRSLAKAGLRQITNPSFHFCSILNSFPYDSFFFAVTPLSLIPYIAYRVPVQSNPRSTTGSSWGQRQLEGMHPAQQPRPLLDKFSKILYLGIQIGFSSIFFSPDTPYTAPSCLGFRV